MRNEWVVPYCSNSDLTVTLILTFEHKIWHFSLIRCHSLKWGLSQNRLIVSDEWLDSIVRKTLMKSAVVDTHWPLTSKSLVGTGLLPPSAMKPTTAVGNVPTSFYRSTRTHISYNRLTLQALPVPVVHLGKCRPYLCYTLTITIT